MPIGRGQDRDFASSLAVLYVSCNRMAAAKKRQRKHGVVQRAFAALGVLTFLVVTVLVLIFELTAVLLAVYAAALAAIVGPALTEGADGFLDVVIGIIELVVEGVAMIGECIASLFAGFFDN
jgi:hypothetical protein